jgi:hypothetical protein
LADVFVCLPLNPKRPDRDQGQAHHAAADPGYIFMESIRPDQPEPIPLRNPPQGIGTIMIRFVGLLLAAIVMLALAWSR